MKNNILASILFSLLSFFNLSASQNLDTPDQLKLKKVTISHQSIENYRNDPEFDYTVKIKNENIISRVIDWFIRGVKNALNDIFEWIFGTKNAGKYLAKLIAALPYFAIIFFMYLFFKYLLGIDLIKMRLHKNSRLPMVDLTDDEAIIKNANFQELIEKAVAEHNYRLAVRYHYLALLKELTGQGIIDWRVEKTNRDYVKEVKHYSIASIFKKLTILYDYIWYGNFDITHQEYTGLLNDFAQIKRDKK